MQSRQDQCHCEGHGWPCNCFMSLITVDPHSLCISCRWKSALMIHPALNVLCDLFHNGNITGRGGGSLRRILRLAETVHWVLSEHSPKLRPSPFPPLPALPLLRRLSWVCEANYTLTRWRTETTKIPTTATKGMAFHRHSGFTFPVNVSWVLVSATWRTSVWFLPSLHPHCIYLPGDTPSDWHVGGSYPPPSCSSSFADPRHLSWEQEGYH